MKTPQKVNPVDSKIDEIIAVFKNKLHFTPSFYKQDVKEANR